MPKKHKKFGAPKEDRSSLRSIIKDVNQFTTAKLNPYQKKISNIQEGGINADKNIIHKNQRKMPYGML